MQDIETNSIEQAARVVFETIKPQLEADHMNQFVSIEPVSGEYFTGPTLSSAVGASRVKYPERLVHTFRIGHRAAVHFGMHTR